MKLSAIALSVSTLSTLVTATPAGAAPPGRITEVVVYPTRARITRRVPVDCQHLTTSIPGLPAAADPSTFRAHLASGQQGTLQSLRWQPRLNTVPAAPRATNLHREIAKLDEQIKAASQALDRLDASAEARARYYQTAEKLVGDQMADGSPNIGAWKRALETVVRAQLGAEKTRAAAADRQRQLTSRRDILTNQLAALGPAAERSEHEVDLVITCSGEGVEAVLTYMVDGAGWSPLYDARLRSRDTVIDLGVQATVHQSTGEDWSGARLVLSTALPREDVTPPVLAPLLVRTGEGAGPSLVSRHEGIQQTPGAGTQAASATGTRTEALSQGLSVQMTLPAPVTVPGDGQPIRVHIARNRQKPTIRLRAVPRLAPHVYRVAELVNVSPFPLLPGSIDVYREGSFLGRDQVSEIPVRGRFTVTLGVEERLRVRRHIVEESVRVAGLFGKGLRHDYSYRFDLGNHLTTPLQIELVDHLPVSELDDVRVVLHGRTTGGHRLDPRDGLIRWWVKLDPGAERQLNLAFHLDVPARYR